MDQYILFWNSTNVCITPIPRFVNVYVEKQGTNCTEFSDKFDTTLLFDPCVTILSIHCSNYCCWSYRFNISTFNHRHTVQCMLVFLNIYDFFVVLLKSISFENSYHLTAEANTFFLKINQKRRCLFSILSRKESRLGVVLNTPTTL